MKKAPYPRRRIPVRVRTVVQPNGWISSRSVYCPSQQASLPIAECEICEHCEGVVFRRPSQGSFITCRPQIDGEEKAAKSPAASAAEQTPIHRAMTGDVFCVMPDLTLDALATLFLERGFSAAPVVDEEGHPMGVVSKTDLMRVQREPERAGEPVVRDVMTALAFTLHESDALARGAAVMVVEGVHHLPVVADDGRVVGMLSAFDCARFLAREAGYLGNDRAAEQ
jgi:CBS domain-containing protein